MKYIVKNRRWRILIYHIHCRR